MFIKPHVNYILEVRNMAGFEVETAFIKYRGKRDDYLLRIHSEYLSSWDMCVTANILKQLFFSKYEQSRSALKRMCAMGLLKSSNVDGYYVVVTGK